MSTSPARLPLVSVLTPSFNQGRWIAETIKSVSAQTYPHIEHIVVDGGSTDGTLEILRAAPPQVRWISEPDAGQSAAINKAFTLSSGSIIGWLNSDDAYFSRNAVGTAVELFRRHTKVTLVYGHSILVDADGTVLHVNWAPRFRPRVFRMHNFIVQPAAFVRRSAVGDRLVDDAFAYSMDRELWLRLAREGRPERLGVPVAIDRHHPDRKSYTRPDLYSTDLSALLRRYDVLPEGRGLVRLKAMKVALRWAGLSLAVSLPGTGEPACAIEIPRLARRLLNQVAIPRSRIRGSDDPER